MNRFGRLVIGILIAAAWGSGTSYAQTTERKWSGQVDGGATLGHSTSGMFGAEVDYRWARSWELAFEVGHMGNIASSALEDRAQVIGDALGVTATPTQSAIYYDLGLRFRLMPDGQWNPYLALGFGGSSVSTETDFQDADLSGVQLGSDLDGKVTKAFFMFGGGVNVPFKERYFVDGSLRYGRVLANTGEIEDDEATTTFRLQVGVGVRF